MLCNSGLIYHSNFNHVTFTTGPRIPLQDSCESSRDVCVDEAAVCRDGRCACKEGYMEEEGVCGEWFNELDFFSF